MGNATIWAMRQSALSDLRAAQESGRALFSLIENTDPDKGPTNSGETSIPFVGPFLRRSDPYLDTIKYPYVNSETVARRIRSAAQPGGSIVIEIDSPGGESSGLDLLIDAINDAKTTCEVVGHICGDCCSAALMVASACTRITATPMSIIGSIGVYSVWEDSSNAYESAGISVYAVTNDGATVKSAGVDGTTITESMLADAKAMVNAVNEKFIDQLVIGRKLTRKHLMELNTGESWIAESALAKGLIDEVSTKPPALAGAEKGKQMLDKIKPLLMKHQKHMATIISMAEDGKEPEEIEAAVAQKDNDEEMASLKEENASLKDHVNELSAKLKALEEGEKEGEQASSKARAQQLADAHSALMVAQKRIDELKGFSESANEDPGESASGAPSIDMEARAKTGQLTASESASLVQGFLQGKY